MRLIPFVAWRVLLLIAVGYALVASVILHLGGLR